MTYDLSPERKQAAESYSETVRRYIGREVIAVVTHIPGEFLDLESEGKNG